MDTHIHTHTHTHVQSSKNDNYLKLKLDAEVDLASKNRGAAIWFIKTIGSISSARAVFEATASGIEIAQSSNANGG